MSNTFVPWWGDKEVVTEYVAPGIRYIRDAKTGEEEIRDEFLYFHDAENIGLLLVAVLYNESVA